MTRISLPHNRRARGVHVAACTAWSFADGSSAWTEAGMETPEQVARRSAPGGCELPSEPPSGGKGRRPSGRGQGWNGLC